MTNPAPTTEEREQFETHYGILPEQRRAPSAGGYASRDLQFMWLYETCRFFQRNRTIRALAAKKDET